LFFAVARVYRFELTGVTTATGVMFVSHVHYQTDVPVGEGEPSASTVLDKILDHYSSSGQNMSKWAAVTGTDAKLTRAVLREEVLDPEATPPNVAEKLLNIPGTVTPTADKPPTPLCVWIKFNTGLALRSFRGGTHLPPLVSVTPLGSDGTIDTGSAYYTAAGALSDSIEDHLENVFSATGDVNAVVYSRTRRARNQSFVAQIETAEVRNDFRWLRRRMTAP
jgi:hypothetical protein